MLGNCKVVAMIATTQPEKARVFYGEVLGLKLLGDDPNAIDFEVGGTRLHVQKVLKLSPQPFTALGWSVSDIEGAVEKS